MRTPVLPCGQARRYSLDRVSFVLVVMRSKEDFKSELVRLCAREASSRV